MADDAGRVDVFPSDYKFRWEIQHPFLPWQRSEADFYGGMWRAAVEPVARFSPFREFVFSVEFLPSLADRHRCFANRIKVNMSLNENTMVTKNEANYLFSGDNRYQYSIHAYCKIFKPEECPHFDIDVSISLSDPWRTTQSGNGQERVDPFQLLLLSESMRGLLDKSPHSDMNLQSALDDTITFPVHSYVLRVRWNKLCEIHEFQAGNQDTLEVDISVPVLEDILVYVYSAHLTAHKSWSNDRIVPYFSEMFQNITRYHLRDLYECFCSRHLKQNRIDRKMTSCGDHISFPLHTVGNCVFNNYDYTRRGVIDGITKFIIQFQMGNQYGSGPWLSFSVQSNAETRFYFHVTFQFEGEPSANGTVAAPTRTVYETDLVLDPNMIFRSGPFLFLGCPATFPELNQTRLQQDGRIGQYKLKIVWHITDGNVNSRIEKIDGVQFFNMESARKLSQDMIGLKKQGDLTLVSGDDGLYSMVHRVHKGIFAIRVPQWQQVLEDCQGVSELPNFARCNIETMAMYHILDYMYTGKSTDIAECFEDEIQEFARRGGCEFLTRLFRPGYHVSG